MYVFATNCHTSNSKGQCGTNRCLGCHPKSDEYLDETIKEILADFPSKRMCLWLCKHEECQQWSVPQRLPPQSLPESAACDARTACQALIFWICIVHMLPHSMWYILFPNEANPKPLAIDSAHGGPKFCTDEKCNHNLA